MTRKYKLLPDHSSMEVTIDSVEELNAWAANMEEFKRVAETTLENGVWVSTVFLGMDHNWMQDGPPLLFETVAFRTHDNMEEIDMDRYATWAEAERGHGAMVARMHEAMVKPPTLIENEAPDTG